MEKNINGTDVNALFEIPLNKGITDVQSWFDTAEGDTLGAYYVYVRLLDMSGQNSN